MLVENRTVVASPLRPDPFQFFRGVRAEASGLVQHVQKLVRSGQSVRVPVPDLRPGPVYTPRWPGDSPRNVACPRRYARRPGKLTPTQESTIRALAGTKSVRSLAADFEVSHETVRSVLKR